MSKYVAQIIVNFLTGEDDQIILNSVPYLVAKGTQQGVASHVVQGNGTRPAVIKEMVKHMQKPWRLYLHGHGNLLEQRLGSLKPASLAWCLASWGLADNPPDAISITSCQLALGGDYHAGPIERIAPGCSFVGQLHRVLNERHHIQSTIYGRTMEVMMNAATLGQKMTRDPISGRTFHKQAFSKVTFYWQAGEQRFEYTY